MIFKSICVNVCSSTDLECSETGLVWGFFFSRSLGLSQLKESFCFY